MESIVAAARLGPRRVLRFLGDVELFKLGRITNAATIRIDRHWQAGRTAALAILGRAEPIRSRRHGLQSDTFKSFPPVGAVEPGDSVAHRARLVRTERNRRKDQLALAF